MPSANRRSAPSAPTTPTVPLPAPQARPVKDPLRKKILLLGHHRSGKSAVHRVVFAGVAPKDTFYNEPSLRVAKDNVDSIVPLQIWDCPGAYAVENLDQSLAAFSSLVFIVDIQDDYSIPLAQLVHLMAFVWEVNKDINLEVFVHKAEGMSEDYKIDNFRQLQQRVYEETLDHVLPLENLSLRFYLTSVYDHSIYDGWSLVIQRLVESLPTLENLLNVLCSNSGITKAYLFDVKSLIYVATDSSPPDPATHGLCCEYVQTLLQFSELYKNIQQLPSTPPPTTSTSAKTPPASTPSSETASPPSEKSPLVPPPNLRKTTSSSTGSSAKSSNSTVLQAPAPPPIIDVSDTRVWASSSVRLEKQSTLAYWEITPQLSLVALIRSATYEASQALIDHNVTFFRKAVGRIVEMEKEKWPK